MPGLNAAFVNVGHEKDAFLHYLDLGSQFSTYAKFLEEALDDKNKMPQVSRIKREADIDKHGTIVDALAQGSSSWFRLSKSPSRRKGRA